MNAATRPHSSLVVEVVDSLSPIAFPPKSLVAFSLYELSALFLILFMLLDGSEDAPKKKKEEKEKEGDEGEKKEEDEQTKTPSYSHLTLLHTRRALKRMNKIFWKFIANEVTKHTLEWVRRGVFHVH